MNQFFFSIVVPVYNVEKYLRDCLNSILLQTFTDYEIICINDASTDSSYKILTQYSEEYSNIKVINLDSNHGLSHARNVGIEKSNGKYILFVDSDDMIVPNMLEVLNNSINDESIEILYFNMEIRDAGNWAKENKYEVEYDEYKGIYRGKELFARFYINKQMKIEAVRQAYLKEFIMKNHLRFYEGIYHEDVLFSFLSAMNAEKVKNINSELYIYRRRDGSIMSSINVKRMESLVIIISEIFHYWKEYIKADEIEEVIASYLNDLVKQVKKYKAYFPEHNKLNIGTKADQFIYNLLFQDDRGKYFYIDITKEQIKYIKKYRKIVIYGAGTVGMEVMQFLEENNIFNFFFTVTNKEVNAETVMNKKIYQIDEIKEIWSTALFIVAIEKSKQHTLKEILKDKGIKNILLPNMK